jgi:hypothetical protein
MDNEEIIQADRVLILNLGGTTKVAEALGFDKTAGGVQRVQNWMTRGIPAQVKLDYPDLFLRDLRAAAQPPESPALPYTIPNGAKAREAKDRMGRQLPKVPE